MRGALLAAALGLGLAAPAPALATEPSWLRGACADGDLYYTFGACAGYLMAVVEAAPGHYCLPADASYLTISADAQALIEDVPVAEDESSAALAAALLARLYPC
jgi:hypothetical protein